MRENIPDAPGTDDRDPWPVERRFTRADQAEMPRGLSITSVFDLAFAGFTLREPMPGGTRCPHYRIERGEGVTRYRQVEEQQTQAWIKREENRRARQVLPRPPKAAKAYWSQFADGQQPSQEPKPKRIREPRPKAERKPRGELAPRVALETLDRAIALVQGGMSIAKAGEVIGIGRDTIAKHMKRRGIPTPPSTRQPAGVAA